MSAWGASGEKAKEMNEDRKGKRKLTAEVAQQEEQQNNKWRRLEKQAQEDRDREFAENLVRQEEEELKVTNEIQKNKKMIEMLEKVEKEKKEQKEKFHKNKKDHKLFSIISPQSDKESESSEG